MSISQSAVSYGLMIGEAIQTSTSSTTSFIFSWLNSYKYLKASGHIQCALGNFICCILIVIRSDAAELQQNQLQLHFKVASQVSPLLERRKKISLSLWIVNTELWVYPVGSDNIQYPFCRLTTCGRSVSLATTGDAIMTCLVMVRRQLMLASFI